MRHLELHILQSVPVACLNRDDFGSPKTAIFGGVQRARVSSQCWKRAIRELAQETAPASFTGQRTRLIIEPLITALQGHGFSAEEAFEGAKKIVEAINKYDADTEKKSVEKGELVRRVKTLFFTSPHEVTTMAAVYAETRDTKKVIKAMGGSLLKDAADISLFGRMVANDHSLTLEGAAMFSHALSTHKVTNEIDFYAAVDDCLSAEESGAGMTGTLEYNSATYYRFAALNLDMLADKNHLGALSLEERQAVVGHFIEATIKAVPSARQNSMNGNTLPSYVLCVVREKGHPVQLVNAFEAPVQPKHEGVVKASRARMDEEYAHLCATWNLSATLECRVPDMPLSVLLEEVTRHVI